MIYNDNLLFAPDCIRKGNRFYLYYCQPGPQAEGIAYSMINGMFFTTGQHMAVKP